MEERAVEGDVRRVASGAGFEEFDDEGVVKHRKWAVDDWFVCERIW